MTGLAFPKPPPSYPADRRRPNAVSKRASSRERQRADSLCAQLVKQRARNRCEAFGYAGIDFHHKHFGKHPLEWLAWIGRKIGLPALEAVRLLSNGRETVDVGDVIAGLRRGVFVQGDRA